MPNFAEKRVFPGRGENLAFLLLPLLASRASENAPETRRADGKTIHFNSYFLPNFTLALCIDKRDRRECVTGRDIKPRNKMHKVWLLLLKAGH